LNVQKNAFPHIWTVGWFPGAGMSEAAMIT
jgi:hypothetical protein